MSVGTALQSAARKLIDDVFGNAISIYSYSSATKSLDSEGHETVTNWGTATSKYAVYQEFVFQIVESLPQFEETLGNASILVRDDTTIAVKDKVTMNNVDFQVDKIDQTSRSNGTLILQGVELHRMEG